MVGLDFSQAKVQAIGIAFTAMETTVNTKTKQQLEEEESVEQSSVASDPSKTSQTVDKTIPPNLDERTVVFADPTNGDLVKLNLSNESINKLKQHFSSENNFFERKDGSLRLNGEAEAYVSGWFGDIAYKREFLKADANKDGKLSDEEYQNTKNGYSTIGEAKGIGRKVLSIIETVTETYTSPHTDKMEGSESIESMLDFTIKSDKDASGTLSNEEALDSVGGYRVLLIDNAKKHLGNIDNNRPNPFDDKTAEMLKLLLEKTNNKEATAALQKLKASNGNESVLTAVEKEALGAELAIAKKEFEKQKDLQSVKEEITIKVRNTQFLDTVG